MVRSENDQKTGLQVLRTAFCLAENVVANGHISARESGKTTTSPSFRSRASRGACPDPSGTGDGGGGPRAEGCVHRQPNTGVHHGSGYRIQGRVARTVDGVRRGQSSSRVSAGSSGRSPRSHPPRRTRVHSRPYGAESAAIPNRPVACRPNSCAHGGGLRGNHPSCLCASEFRCLLTDRWLSS